MLTGGESSEPSVRLCSVLAQRCICLASERWYRSTVAEGCERHQNESAGVGRTTLILPKNSQLAELPHTEFPRSWVGATASQATFRWELRMTLLQISTTELPSASEGHGRVQSLLWGTSRTSNLEREGAGNPRQSATRGPPTRDGRVKSTRSSLGAFSTCLANETCLVG